MSKRDKRDSEPFETKTTTIKLAEPLKLKRCVFAKGSKTEITWNLDPNNPIHLDALLLSVERSSVKQAVIAFEKFIEECLYLLG